MIEEFLANGDKFHNEGFNIASDHNVIFEAVLVPIADSTWVGIQCHRFASKILLHPHCLLVITVLHEP